MRGGFASPFWELTFWEDTEQINLGLFYPFPRPYPSASSQAVIVWLTTVSLGSDMTISLAVSRFGSILGGHDELPLLFYSYILKLLLASGHKAVG